MPSSRRHSSIAVAIVLWIATLLSLAVAGPSTLRAQLHGGDPDYTPPTIAFTPWGGAQATQPITVTIDWCDDQALNAASRSITLNGVDVTGSFTFVWGTNPSCGESARSVGTIALPLVTNSFSAQIRDGNFNWALASTTFSVNAYPVITAGSTEAAPGGPSVAAAAQAFAYTELRNGTWSQIGTITGSRVTVPTGGTARFSMTGSDVVAVGSVAWDVWNPAGQYVGGAGWSPVTGTSTTATFDRLLDQPGNWSVHAYLQDTRGYIRVVELVATAMNYTASALDLPPLQPTARVGPGSERELCLTFAAGHDGAIECGDLRLAHALPTVRTKDKARTPVLVYNSQTAHPYPIVSDTLTLASPLPSSVQATLQIQTGGGTVTASGSWNGTDWTAGATRRIAVKYDAMSVATGLYAYSFAITKIVSGTLTAVRTDTGHVVIVNRSMSHLSPGWWLAGLEQIIAEPDSSKLFVGGDGSSRVYYPVAGRTDMWSAPQVDARDFLKRQSVNGATYYVQYLPHGVRVLYDAALGWHRFTVNRLGDTTTFGWDASGFLQTITVPLGPSPTYRFAYAGGWLASVSQTSSTQTRTTTLHWDNGQVLRITDPDGQYVTVYYDPVQAGWNRITWRANRLRDTSYYTYDAASKVSRVAMPMHDLTQIVTSYVHVDGRGLAGTSATDTTKLYTLFDGPRTDVPDTTAFWLDRFGAPRRILGPTGVQTTITRGDARWPSLATQTTLSHFPILLTGNVVRTISATYDTLGHIATETDQSSCVGSVCATSRYAWDPAWDEVTKIVRPMGDSVVMAYNPADGNRLWQQDARGDSTRVKFGYNGQHLVDAIQEPGALAATTVGYDALANERSVRTPLGFVSYAVKDELGRDTLLLSPIDSIAKSDSASARWLATRSTYDVMDEVLSTTTTSPLTSTSIAGAPDGKAQTLIVSNTYDPEGHVTLTRRTQTPSETGIVAISNQWVYDAAGRRVVAIDGNGRRDSTEYDRAGNAIAAISRNAYAWNTGVYAIRMQYDVLDRLTQRVTPAYDIVPADTATFAYHPVFGSLTEADNGDAKVTRTYYPNGLLNADTVHIRTYKRIGAGGNFTQHVYGIRHAYDLDGRQTTLFHPSTLAPSGLSGVDTTHYTYNAAGMLDALISPSVGGAISKYQYVYDARARLISLRFPGSVTEAWSYDDDGRMLRHSGSYPAVGSWPAGTLYGDTIRYDARGKAIRANTGNGIYGNIYSGIGGLISNHNTLATGNQAPMLDDFVQDAMGNTAWNHRFIPVYRMHPTEPETVQKSSYDPYSGRLQYTMQWRIGTDSTSAGDWDEAESNAYDPAGNVTDVVRIEAPSDAANTVVTQLTSFYGLDNKLRHIDKTTTRWTINDSPGGYYYNWQQPSSEDMRYDALGRRVLHYTRQQTIPSCIQPDCQDAIDRTIWDGDQIFYEVHLPAPISDTLSWEATDYYVGYGAGPQYFGRVGYLHGGVIDRPLGIIRLGYGGSTGLNAFTVSPHANWRGQFDAGTYADGSIYHCDAGCALIDWPATNTSVQMQSYFRGQLLSWMGSLAVGGRDGSGLMYMRNRYYDPGNGRFTQEDPIGLAGGLNAYGFAGGDPVNYSDPFGLCIGDLPCPKGFVNAIAGFGDGASFGLSALIRRITPGGDGVDYGSRAYAAGAVVGVAATTVITSGLGSEGAAGEVGTTAERSGVGVGEYSGESIPARSAGRDFTSTERGEINRIGRETGCHTCGTKNPGTKTGNFVPDHQPPSSINPAGGPQRLYPQCLQCSREQGLELARILRTGGTP